MMKKIKMHLTRSMATLFLIFAMVFSASSVTANPCLTKDGFLDTGIGGTGFTKGPSVKGIGGTGFTGHRNEKGIGGTGQHADNHKNAIGGTGVEADGNGIGGTGKVPQGDVELIHVTGTIHAFGSVCVNGVEIQYAANTPVATDTNQTFAAASLRVGQVVDVLAEKRAGDKMPKAKSISVRFPLQGRVTAISPGGDTIKVMGRPVRLTGPRTAKSLRLGALVRVSGLQDVQGRVVATFIETLPRQAAERTAPPKPRTIPSNVSKISVQGYVQGITSDGRVIIEGQGFDLGASGKNVAVGTRMIVSGKRQEDGTIKASHWIRERTLVKTRLQFGEAGDSDRRHRNRGHGGGNDDAKEDNSGRGRADRPNDNSGSGSGNPDRIDNSGPGNNNPDRIDNSGSGRADRVARPDNSGSGRGGRPDRVDRSGRADRPDRIDRSGRPDRPARIDRPQRPDRSGRPDRPVRPDRSGRGGGG